MSKEEIMSQIISKLESNLCTLFESNFLNKNLPEKNAYPIFQWLDDGVFFSVKPQNSDQTWNVRTHKDSIGCSYISMNTKTTYQLWIIDGVHAADFQKKMEQSERTTFLINDETGESLKPLFDLFENAHCEVINEPINVTREIYDFAIEQLKLYSISLDEDEDKFLPPCLEPRKCSTTSDSGGMPSSGTFDLSPPPGLTDHSDSFFEDTESVIRLGNKEIPTPRNQAHIPPKTTNKTALFVTTLLKCAAALAVMFAVYHFAGVYFPNLQFPWTIV